MCWIKLLFAGVIAATAGLELVTLTNKQGLLDSANIFTASQLLQLATLVVSVILHYYEQTRSRRSSDILLMYWLTAWFVPLVVLRTDYLGSGDHSSNTWNIRCTPIAENLRRIDANQRCYYSLISLDRWLSIRLEWISAFVVFGAALLGVVSLVYGKADAGLVGLAVTYALQSTQQLSYMLRLGCDVENNMCDYVRIQEIEQLPSEAPEVIEVNKPDKAWPEQGMLEFQGYSTRYREGLDLVLKDLSFRVMPNQKVGIVGRTGAGKSSLTLALFRIVEAAEGRILLDGEDIAQYGLFGVRSKLSIIPQDPVLFAGTVRENLDPFSNYSDQEIWDALQHAHLAEFIRTKEEGLDFAVSQGGDNFSVGQRQLICLARALLKRAKVLVLDEATAAIDNSTDAIIQESIRKEFKNCTVLTIAHRLNTIIDSDMVLVLDNGKVAEYDTPQNLLANKNGLFKELWAAAIES
ncbi:hypothetical protein GGI22_001932 [Coemansia erecta]|nr:hypothetical protein GGI22_001932 [Coemansia erecta]